MESIPYLTSFAIGFVLACVVTWIIAQRQIRLTSESVVAAGEAERSVLKTQMESGQKRVTELSADVSERDRRISELLDDRSREMTRRAAAEELSKRVPVLERQVAEEQTKLSDSADKIVNLERERAELATTLSKDREAFSEKVQLLEDAKKQLSGVFSELSSAALQSNNQQFLDLAKESLSSFHDGAQSDLEKRQESISNLVKPVRESLEKVDQKIQEMEKERAGAYEGLKQQVTELSATGQGLRSETSNLVKALRSPRTRGVWGEMQLRRVIELSGMLEHCDFVEQESVTTDTGLLRPDVLVRMPGAKTIVIDSKTPLEHYLDAIGLEDDNARTLKLKEHARVVRDHIKALGKKSYADAFSGTLDFVVLFVPGESFYSAAIEQDPTLIEFGLSQNVVLATPATLIGLLKAVAYGWREESLKENAQKISTLGRELYERLSKMGGYLMKLGRSLETVVESYNQTIGSMESRVLVTARKFKGLSVTNANGTEIEGLEPVERVPRLVQAPEYSLEEDLPLFSSDVSN
jgi:DNA recombination protein RmuC